jgi:hypothetical protein
LKRTRNLVGTIFDDAYPGELWLFVHTVSHNWADPYLRALTAVEHGAIIRAKQDRIIGRIDRPTLCANVGLIIIRQCGCC